MTEVAYPAEARQIKLMGRVRATLPIENQWFGWKARQCAGNLLEIGTHFGHTTRELACACHDRIVFTVDYTASAEAMHPDQRREMPTLQEIGIEARGLPNVFISIQRSESFDYFRKNIGFVFIDGDHSYEGVRADTRTALASLVQEPRALTLVWHDVYNHSWVGVKRFLETEMTALPVCALAETHVAYADLGLEHVEAVRTLLAA